MDQSTRPFVHQRLSDHQSIRLWTLHQGSGDSQIECSLGIVSQKDNSVPAYEAISYTWATEDGNQSRSQCLLVDGLVMYITCNCEAALRRFRLEDCSRVLWIDAVCIDQDHVAEVNAQVSLMGQIYSRTHRTLIWLGKGDNGSDEAIQWLDRYSLAEQCSNIKNVAINTPDFNLELSHEKGIHADARICEVLGITLETLLYLREGQRQYLREGHDQPAYQEKIRTYGYLIHQAECHFEGECTKQFEELKNEISHHRHRNTSLWTSLQAIFNRQWWRRVWVLQEASLAKDARLFCGEYETDYARLTSYTPPGLLGSAEHPWQQLGAHRLFRKVIHREPPFDDYAPVPRPLNFFLAARSNLASDPRDKIYGILGLFGAVGRMNIPQLPKPDYNKTVAEVYLEMATLFVWSNRRMADTTDALALLYQCTGENSIQQLASWVPDWSDPPTAIWTAEDFRACSFMVDIWYKHQGQIVLFNPTIRMRQDGATLYLHARAFDGVGRIARPSPPDDPSDETTCRLFKTWIDMANSHSQKLLRQTTTQHVFCALASLGQYQTVDQEPEAREFRPDDKDEPQRSSRDYQTWAALLMADKPVADIVRDVQASDVASMIQARVVQDTKGRVAFLTTRGHVGSIPRTARKDDVVVYFPGGRMPYVLRPWGTHFEAVGPCYVVGAMNGEGLMMGDEDFEWIAIR